MRKRVAIIVWSLYGGGMERVTAQLSIMLSDCGYDVCFFVGCFDKRRVYKHKGNVIVLPFIFWHNGQTKVKELSVLLYNAYQLRTAKKENKIDITISFAPEMNMVNIISGTKDKKILTIHSCLSARQDLKGLYYKRKLYRLYNYAYKVIAVSKWCKKDLICHYGINKDKINVIYNPVENRCNQYIQSVKENVVLVVGRMHDIKQQWHIIRAFKMVVSEVPDAKLIVAGHGENMKYLNRLCSGMKMDSNVVFLGFINEIDKLYQQAKCVVFSSASEAFPCSVIEAISNGVPVVASDCPGGIREILTEKMKQTHQIDKAVIVKGGILTPKLDGVKYDANNPLTKAECELAKGIIYLLKDETRRLEIAENCVKISKSFAWKEIRKEWVKLMQSVL